MDFYWNRRWRYHEQHDPGSLTCSRTDGFGTLGSRCGGLGIEAQGSLKRTFLPLCAAHLLDAPHFFEGEKQDIIHPDHTSVSEASVSAESRKAQESHRKLRFARGRNAKIAWL